MGVGYLRGVVMIFGGEGRFLKMFWEMNIDISGHIHRWSH